MTDKKTSPSEQINPVSAESIAIEPSPATNSQKPLLASPQQPKQQQVSAPNSTTLICYQDDLTPSFGTNLVTHFSSSKKPEEPKESSLGQVEKTKSVVGPNNDDGQYVEVYEQSQDGSVDLSEQVLKFGSIVRTMRRRMGLGEVEQEGQIVPIGKRTRMKQKQEEKKEEKKQAQLRNMKAKNTKKSVKTAENNKNKAKDKAKAVQPEPEKEQSINSASTGKKRGRPKSNNYTHSPKPKAQATPRDKTTTKMSAVKAEESESEDRQEEEEIADIRQLKKVRLGNMTCLVTFSANTKKEMKLSQLARDSPALLIRYLTRK